CFFSPLPDYKAPPHNYLHQAVIGSTCVWLYLCFMLLVAAVITEAQKTPSINNSVILVTPRLASYCGFSMKIDPLGDAIVYASLQNCFALNVKRPIDKGFKITKVVGQVMKIANTPTRLTLRSSKTAPERTSSNIYFTPYTIIWFLPKFIEPLISTNQPRLLEVFVGIDGHRLRSAEIAARGYAITVTDLHIIVHILNPGVFYLASHYQIMDDQPFKTYTIEPMLELLWTEGTTLENTRYKVLFPITIPVPQIVDISRLSGSCDHANFYVLVKYGTHGAQFQTLLGKRTLSPDLAQQYNARENGTHFSVTVPFSAPDVVFEAVQGSSIRSRLDVTLRNPQTGRHVKDFALTCQFYSTLTECFPNGTITTVAVKVESVPSLNPGQLTLRDPNCGPRFSDDRFAYFVFTANSCGTKRKFLPNVMRYENEISLPNYLEKQDSQSEESEYELKVICYYVVNTTYALTFHTRARRSQPYAEAAKGKLQIAMRLALDDTYSAFHQDEDYPLTKFLQEPLYFEVELMTLTNPHVSLELENCWATADKDGTSQPRWNLIINGCVNPVDPHQVVFHSVWVDARVKYPSHHKRFEVRTFSFMKDQDTMSPQMFVHCDVVICDSRNPQGGVCNGQCSNQMKGNG
uniref:ZP domain-containing protein n=1 Tax=Sphaeramia orbicularis TaxID=375764 RepID=A0A673BM59_9TELE